MYALASTEYEIRNGDNVISVAPTTAAFRPTVRTPKT